MSAIAALVHWDDRPLDPLALQSVAASLDHRGPDGGGTWTDGPVGLVHRLLHARPECARETLPLVDRSGLVVLTADARLDNRDELARILGLGPAAGATDAELILGAYARWGEACPAHLLGDFAFALWDARRHQLVCARDPLGVKPLYYHATPARFACATELKALLALPDVPRRLDETRVADYLVLLFDDPVRTFHREILRLPPAHSAVANRDGVALRRYWTLDPTREASRLRDEDHAEAFRDLFLDAVRCRLPGAGRVGALLSGGLDSSSIVGAARHLLAEAPGAELHTFSAVFPDLPACDERPFIDAVVSRGGVVPHAVRADRLNPLGDLDRVLWHEDEPFHAPNLFLHWALYGAARAEGVPVLLDGIDGDTTVSHGLARLADLLRTGRWRTLGREVRVLSRHLRRSPWGILWRQGLRPLVPPTALQLARCLKARGGRARWLNPTLDTGFVRRIGLESRLAAVEAAPLPSGERARAAHYRGLTWGILPFYLEVADRAAAAFAIEPRYPFYDRRLVEFCLALPADQKLRDGWSRLVLRRATAGLLPEEIRWRTDKSDLAPNFERSFLEQARPQVEDVLRVPEAIAGYVDPDALRAAWGRCLGRPRMRDLLGVWTAVTLALWLKRSKMAAS